MDAKNLELLLKQILVLHQRKRKEFKEKWGRVIPFYETVLGDKARWEKAQFLKFGENTSIYDSSYVYGDVKVGKNTWIGPFTLLDGSGRLEIGDYCSISAGVQIYTHETVKWALTGGRAGNEYKPVYIGNFCFIGSLSIIRMGVKIGDHCLIGANSYVNKSIPENSIAFGSPAEIAGKVHLDGDKVRLEYFKS